MTTGDLAGTRTLGPLRRAATRARGTVAAARESPSRVAACREVIGAAPARERAVLPPTRRSIALGALSPIRPFTALRSIAALRLAIALRAVAALRAVVAPRAVIALRTVAATDAIRTTCAIGATLAIRTIGTTPTIGAVGTTLAIATETAAARVLPPGRAVGRATPTSLPGTVSTVAIGTRRTPVRTVAPGAVPSFAALGVVLLAHGLSRWLTQKGLPSDG